MPRFRNQDRRYKSETPTLLMHGMNVEELQSNKLKLKLPARQPMQYGPPVPLAQVQGTRATHRADPVAASAMLLVSGLILCLGVLGVVSCVAHHLP